MDELTFSRGPDSVFDGRNSLLVYTARKTLQIAKICH
jgi:hypothetical protein